MFVDQVKIFVKGGDGGKGCVSFRRAEHVFRDYQYSTDGKIALPPEAAVSAA